jgi:hypothetical protein
MSIYYSSGRVPELSAFSESQRHLVVRGAFQLLQKEQPAAAILAGLPGLGAIFGFFGVSGLLELLSITHSSLAIFGGGVVGCLVGAKVGAHIFRVFMRPFYRRYIEGHQDDIKAA